MALTCSSILVAALSAAVRAGHPVWGTPARPLKEYLEQLAVLSRLAKQRKKEKAL